MGTTMAVLGQCLTGCFTRGYSCCRKTAHALQNGDVAR